MAIGETYQREIEVKIPKTKRSENLERLSEIAAELEQAEAAKAEAMGEHNATLKDLRASLRKTNHAIMTGKDLVEVEVKDRLAGREVETVRVDTGEVVAKRPATADELQLDAFEDTPAGESAATRAKAKGERKARPGTVAKPKRGRKARGDGATP